MGSIILMMNRTESLTEILLFSIDVSSSSPTDNNRGRRSSEKSDVTFISSSSSINNNDNKNFDLDDDADDFLVFDLNNKIHLV